MICRRSLCLAVLVSLAIPLALHSVAQAQPSPAATAEAGKHFQRGVTLYNEADFRAALVEFRRAYEIAPNAAVLYNIGQTYYQLQNYAAALMALGRYLTEAGPTAPHRREVEQTIDTLQTRVGKVAISTSAPGADITVDDELVGKTPLDDAVLVSIGRRKITALRDGRVTETRFVDVAAGDTITVSLAADVTRGPVANPAGVPGRDSSGLSDSFWRNTAIASGVVMIGTGGYALYASHDLSNTRNANPVTTDQINSKRDDLNSKSSRLKIASGIADVAGVVAVTAGAIWYFRSRSHETHVAITPTGIQIAGTFR
jgi:PEGA domain